MKNIQFSIMDFVIQVLFVVVLNGGSYGCKA
jgi:hypothetical protein